MNPAARAAWASYFAERIEAELAREDWPALVERPLGVLGDERRGDHLDHELAELLGLTITVA